MRAKFCSGSSGKWRRPVGVSVCGLLLLVTLQLAQAATPPAGTVTSTQSANWQGDPGYTPTAEAGCGGPASPDCDNFALTIDAPVGPFDYVVNITLQPNPGEDWDVEVYDPAGQVIAGSGNAGITLEVIALLNPAAGTYTVAASPFAGSTGYQAMATMTQSVVGGIPGNEQVEFFVYPAPDGSARPPSFGINWLSESDGPAGPIGPLGADNGGTMMYVADLETSRIRLNDCTAPATYLQNWQWDDVSPTSHVLSLNSALFTDPVTGRTFSAQATGTSTVLEWTDNDGDNWLSGIGAGSGAANLHLGGGRLAEPLYSALTGNNPAYNNFAHGVYACFQTAAGAACSLSVDGGISFAPPVPVWTIAECSPRPGRVQVSPVDGAVYVPSRACGSEQGFAYSTDNGATWSLRTVKASGSGSWDPSVGIATDGTLYFGFDNGGRPMTSVSVNGGVSWSVPVDVSFGAVRSTAFPAMVAGDAGRAAFAFLGTATPNAIGSSPGIEAVWDLYVSMTFDAGLSWTTVNVTADDPVQRGSICGDILTCLAGANLADSIDIAMDRRGRPVVAFADGCTGDCVHNPNELSTTALPSIARLKSWKGLLAAHDADRTGLPELPLGTATELGLDVQLDWSEPGDGGNPLTGYRIRRNGQDLATVGPEFRRYTDLGAGGGGFFWEILAQNSAGESRIKTGCSPIIDGGPHGDPCPPFCDTPCTLTGAEVVNDKAGDSDAGLGTGLGPGAYDMLRLGISQSPEHWGQDRIAFVLEVQNTDNLPPDSIWPIQFKDPLNADRFVRMDTMSGEPVYTYGTGTDINPLTAPGTPAEPESGIYGNHIVISVPLSAVNAQADDTINQFLARTRINAGATITPDNMPDSLVPEGTYTLVDASLLCHVDTWMALDDFASTDACSTVDIDVLENDAPPEINLQISSAVRPVNGNIIIFSDADGNKIRYIPDDGFTGVDQFEYFVHDDAGNSDSAIVTVTVNTTPDDDADGVVNSCDNCLLEANADQCDTNNDRFGNVCDADLDNNGITNSFDLSIMRDSFGQGGDNDADLDCNGIVNSFDLTIMREKFGQPPGPTGLAAP